MTPAVHLEQNPIGVVPFSELLWCGDDGINQKAAVFKREQVLLEVHVQRREVKVVVRRSWYTFPCFSVVKYTRRCTA